MKLPIIPVGIGMLEGIILCSYAEKIMSIAELEFRLYKAKAQDTSCLVSWYYKRKAREAFRKWQDGWVLTSTFRKQFKKDSEKISKTLQDFAYGANNEKEEKTKVRKSNSRSKRSKVCE